MERVEVMTAVPPSFQGGHRTRKLSLQTLSSKPCLCIRTIVWPAICCAWCDFILIWYCTNYIYIIIQHINTIILFLFSWPSDCQMSQAAEMGQFAMSCWHQYVAYMLMLPSFNLVLAPPQNPKPFCIRCVKWHLSMLQLAKQTKSFRIGSVHVPKLG